MAARKLLKKEYSWGVVVHPPAEPQVTVLESHEWFDSKKSCMDHFERNASGRVRQMDIPDRFGSYIVYLYSRTTPRIS